MEVLQSSCGREVVEMEALGFGATAIAAANGKLEDLWPAPSSLPEGCSDWLQVKRYRPGVQTCLLSARYRNLKLTLNGTTFWQSVRTVMLFAVQVGGEGDVA